ncbi:MAG: 1-acyl-sn-glycerol-3-phosphate acyltransferase [Clostridiales bacterium]|jgi:1-acyl-sn-glycerol-3-phosphate acyltransferase|nr:1-acyl-sn-glycerol-3-phosphate acyltransferase [Clostridiales bacterium]
MIRTIIWFIYFWLYLIYLIPHMMMVRYYDRKGDIVKRDALVNQRVRLWARALVKLAGGKISVIGEENIPKDRSVVFISNHQGNFDIPILLGYINKPKAFIAKIETKKLPLISSWMREMKCVFMDRKDIRQSVQAINDGAEILREGYSLVIFPEGTRSKGENIGEFKHGSFKLATKAGVPIIPVTIKGSYKMMEQTKFIIRPGKVEIIISKPIETDNLTRDEIKELPDRVKGVIIKEL